MRSAPPRSLLFCARLLVSVLALGSVSPVAAQAEGEVSAPQGDSACEAGGTQVSAIGEGSGTTCQEDEESALLDSERPRVRAERRGSVAAMGTFFALMAAFAVPASFVPQGVAGFLRRIHVLDHDSGGRLDHRSFRARQRYLPLIGMTALSVSALSSRFWWAGVLTAGCGVSSDVLLTQYWHQGGATRRGIGIATASVASLAGLLLDLETLAYSDLGGARAFAPTLSVGVAQLEVGLTGRF